MFKNSIKIKIKDGNFYIAIKPAFEKRFYPIAIALTAMIIQKYTNIFDIEIPTGMIVLPSIFLVLSSFFTKSKIKIFPRKRLVEVSNFIGWDEKKIFWAPEGNLQYETHYDENNKISAVFLISKANTGIQSRDYVSLVRFPDLETFKQFQSTFNKTYPDLRIREWNE